MRWLACCDAIIYREAPSTVTAELTVCSDSETTLGRFTTAQSTSGSSSLSEINESLYGSVGGRYHVPARPSDTIISESVLSRKFSPFESQMELSTCSGIDVEGEAEVVHRSHRRSTGM